MVTIVRRGAPLVPGLRTRVQVGLEMLLVTRDSGDMVRYEFDYDENNFYVYVSHWPANRPNGHGPSHYGPVRRIPRIPAAIVQTGENTHG